MSGRAIGQSWREWLAAELADLKVEPARVRAALARYDADLPPAKAGLAERERHARRALLEFTRKPQGGTFATLAPEGARVWVDSVNSLTGRATVRRARSNRASAVSLADLSEFGRRREEGGW